MATIKKITAQRGQSVLDIAVQHYGTVEGVFELLKLNPELVAIERNCKAGQELWVGQPMNKTEYNRLAERAELPATAADIVLTKAFSNDFSNDFN